MNTGCKYEYLHLKVVIPKNIVLDGVIYLVILKEYNELVLIRGNRYYFVSSPQSKREIYFLYVQLFRLFPDLQMPLG
jgi:hypothetical protein